MSYKKDFLKKIDELSTKTIDLAQSMVRIPSENPPGDEIEVASFMVDIMNSFGLDAEVIEPIPKRANAIGTLKGYGGNKAFLYNGHIDVVPLGNREGWSFDPYGAVIKDKKIYGRGTGDMKGASASAMIAALALNEAGIKLKGDYLIHGVGDEEAGATLGTKYLIEKGYESQSKISMAVVGEGSVHADKIYAQLAIPGSQRLKIIVKGQAAHGSRPHLGINAVLKMSKILLALDEHKFKFTPYPYLPDPSNVAGAVINGGVKEGVVPDYCESTFSVNTVPGMTGEDVINEIFELMTNLKAKDPTINVEIIPQPYVTPSEMKTSDLLYKISNNAVTEAVGYELQPYPFTSGNDTRWIRGAGIPTIVLGPADIPAYNGHGVNEWVSTEKLIEFAKIYGLMAMDVCGFFTNK